MAAPKGNKFWKLRSKHGRDRLFESPELLWESACEYFEWCDENPWISTKDVKTNNGFTQEEKPTERPYSLMGFRLYVGCSESWLREFKKTADLDFLRVIDQIEESIYKQQWEGASVGAFNANIIARTLGLKEQSDVTTNGESLNKELSPDEIKQKAKDLDNDY
jgi:hypothetical protein